jgi:poly[(R)-3-hydroxyalkanoate] polymerase subunit PhaC
MTSTQAVDPDAGAVLAGGGGDAVLAAAMLRSARLPTDTVARVAGAVVRSPDAAARHLVRGLRRQLAVAVGTGEQLPDLDRRFADAAWHTNPALRRLAQSYLVWCDALRGAVADTPLGWRTRQRANLMIDNVVAAAAPTNVPLVNPASAKEAYDTGGASLLRGLSQFVQDIQRPPRLPHYCDPAAYSIGTDLAVTPGAVICRDEVYELLQYAPGADQVDEVPVLMLASPVNKFYLLDLGPGNSVVAALQRFGRQAFVSSWVNPDQRHRDVGLDGYVHAVLDMLATVREITGSPRVHLLGLCGGGMIALAAAGHLAATGREDELASLTLGVTIGDFGDGGTLGALLDAQTAEAAALRAAKRGFYSAADTAAGFAWLRPDEGVWMNVVNNYLLGRPPAGRSELLFWAADNTHLTVRLGRDLTSLQLNNSFATPGALTVLGVPVDLRKVLVATYLLGASTDHIMPWADCYRTRALFGGPTRFVLASGGHAKALGTPPGAPRTSFRTGDCDTPDPAAWLSVSTAHQGSWWEDWCDWITQHTPATKPAPTRLGNDAFPPLADAPGDLVHRRVL